MLLYNYLLLIINNITDLSECTQNKEESEKQLIHFMHEIQEV